MPSRHDGRERQFNLLVFALQDFFDVVNDGLCGARALLSGVCSRLCEIHRISPR
ncbi:hypothetical protein D3C86_2122340 [compost metagenome]